MRKLPSRKLLATLVAGALFIPHTGFTLGLGEIEVSSALNQKLNADIELLSATPEDAETIIIKLASRKEFSRAGLDRPYALNDLSFKSEIVDGVPHIKVSSGSPIREPFLNFLIEIDWPNGHLLREYTVLLDPPVFMTQAAPVDSSDSRPAEPTESRPTASVAAPVPAVTTSSRPAASTQSAVAPVPIPTPVSAEPEPAQTSEPAPAFRPAPVVQQQTPINQPPDSYRIKSGDTAWSLADAMRPDNSVTVPQMMFAILRTNPEAFNHENINGLKRGYILRRPDAAQIAAINKAEAQAMMREHTALWRKYQQSQSGGQPVSAMQADGTAGSVGAGGETATADNAHLAIVSAGTGVSTAGSKDPSEMTAQELRAELALARERVETERVEKEALQTRIDTLEQYAEQREGLLTVEDEELAGVQSLNAPADGEMSDAGMADTESVDAEISESPVADDMAADDMAADGMTDDDMVTDSTAADGEAEQVMSEEAATDAVFTDEVTGQTDSEGQINEAVTDMAEDAAPADAVAQSEAEQRSPADPLTRLLNDPMLLAAAGGGLLLILAIIGLIIKRRKTGSDDTDTTVKSGFADLENLADDIAEETAGEEVIVDSLAGDQVADDENLAPSESDSMADLNAAEESDIAGEDASAEAEESRDDVIAEADVYLAYGIYQQAEDLLNQAILENPDRNDYRVKLAETHYASKNATAFAEVAGEIKTRVDNDDSPEWKKILVMGQGLCADDPMFKGAETAELDLDEVAPDEPSMDFDLSTDEEDVAVSDLNADDELVLPDMNDEAEQSEDDVLAEPAEEIEFDISDTGAVEEDETIEDEFSLDINASELDIEIKDEAEGAIEDEAEEISMDLTDIDIAMDEEDAVADEVHDIGDADIEFGLNDEAEADSEVEPVIEEEVAIDLSDEIEAESVAVDTADDEVTAVTAANDDSADDGDFDLSSLDDVDEISTKLDLARAYLDMGDQEGTRDILQEVLVDGNDEQKQEANELMEKLG